VVSNLGSEGDNIGGKGLVIFGDSFDNVQAVNAALKNQNGATGEAFFLYINTTDFNNKYVLGFDPDLADDSLPAFNLGILQSIDVQRDEISTIIQALDFEFI
jgi:hypothetical protein